MPPAKKTVAAVDWERAKDRLSQAALAAEEAKRASPQRVRAVLAARAIAIARVPDEAPAAGALLEIMRFRLGNEQYALETSYLREVLRPKEITPLPGAPAFLAGVANLRGQILAVLDLRPFFGIAAGAVTELTRVIVLGRERIEFGLLTDAVHEVALLRADELREPPGSVSGIAADYVRGVTADALILLDGAALLKDPRLFIDLSEDGVPGLAGGKS